MYGYFGAQGEGNDLIVYNLPEGWKQGDAVPPETLRFTFPRQREGRGLCISDFFLSKSSGKMDVLGNVVRDHRRDSLARDAEAV